MRRLRKKEKVTRELYQKASRQKKCESTDLHTILSGAGALNAVAGRAKNWPHFRQEVDDDDGGVPTICFESLILERLSWWR